ncbi:MAG TPA: DUF4252 domain-containing protein [Bryobacteraceae bacterium]|nr:DUF4252 domain-containing protein [Bryobacteraceae bacterium]
MKRLVMFVALSGICAWSQSLDLSSLDKLAAKAKQVHKVSLDKNQLQMVMKMNSEEDKKDPDVKKVLNGLATVQVRNFEFDKSGEYSDSDLDAVRAQIAKMQNCTSIVDSKEKDEHSQIFLCSDEGKGTALAVVAAEPKEVSVVYIRGNMNLSDLGKLNGLMGIPDLSTGKGKSDQK